MFLRFFSLNLIYCRLFGNCCNNEQEGEGGGTRRQIYNWLSDLEQAIHLYQMKKMLNQSTPRTPSLTVFNFSVRGRDRSSVKSKGPSLKFRLPLVHHGNATAWVCWLKIIALRPGGQRAPPRTRREVMSVPGSPQHSWAAQVWG